MSIHLAPTLVGGLPPEPRLLKQVRVRLLEEAERARFDELLAREHYLKNPTVVGQALRYVAEHQGQWLALLVFSSAALHLKPRDRWLQWSARQVAQRRHLIAQNQRFLVLAGPGHWPNLASRVLKLTCARLAGDWQRQFGHPVLAVETFVDPQRFRGTCYQAAGWERLGPTRGCQRSWQDFYTDTRHPKEIWVRALGPSALAQLRATELPAALAEHQRPVPLACPVSTDQLPSLWQCFRDRLTDPRKPRGKRHQLASILTLIALAVAAGCKGPHAIAEFARSLNHAQRRQLRCRARAGTRRQCDVPGERTFRRLLKTIAAGPLKDVLVEWMAQQDPGPVSVLHLDGKVVKNAAPAPAGAPVQEVASEIPLELQKPKADRALTLVNFITGRQRLVDQVAVPRNTNEEATVAAHWPHLDLAGVLRHRRCRPHHQGQCPATYPRQRRRLPPGPQRQSTPRPGQGPPTPAGRFSPRWPARSTKATGALKNGRCGCARPIPRPSVWPGRPNSCAWTARSTRCGRAGSSSTPRKPPTA